MKAYVPSGCSIYEKEDVFFLKTVDNVDSSVDNQHNFLKRLLLKGKNGLWGRFLELDIKWFVDKDVYN